MPDDAKAHWHCHPMCTRRHRTAEARCDEFMYLGSRVFTDRPYPRECRQPRGTCYRHHG